jgi:hypothetical protein
MKRISSALLLASAFAAAVMAQGPVTRRATIGTFDSRSIVMAYYDSPQMKAIHDARQREWDAAMKANDTVKAQKLRTDSMTQAVLAFDQASGRAPIDNILKALKPAFKEIEAKLQLKSIVAAPPRDASVATVDVTEQLLEWLQADAQTRKWINDEHPHASTDAQPAAAVH